MLHPGSRALPGSESTPAATRASAPVIEVFASFQGEGRYVGEAQTFVRLAGCPLRCRWCDTPGSWALGGEDATARIDALKGRRREPREATAFQTACWIAQVEPGAPRTVSVTGGEPLLWPEFLLELPRFLGGRRVHLETAGAHPQALARVLDAVQHVSLDLKLPDDLDAPEELAGLDSEPAPTTRADWAEARAECLRLVKGRDACAKLIVSADRSPERYDELVESLAEHAPDVPLYVQPVTAVRDVRAPELDTLTAVVERARALGLAARVIPQIHKVLGLP